MVSMYHDFRSDPIKQATTDVFTAVLSVKPYRVVLLLRCGCTVVCGPTWSSRTGALPAGG
eukprot:7387476-Prymnesium_polylepis.1